MTGAADPVAIGTIGSDLFATTTLDPDPDLIEVASIWIDDRRCPLGWRLATQHATPPAALACSETELRLDAESISRRVQGLTR